MPGRRFSETGEIETQTAGVGDRESVESCEKIGCPRDCLGCRQTRYCKETEEETEPFTGAPCATFCRHESPMGGQESCRGKQRNRAASKFADTFNAAAGKQRRQRLIISCQHWHGNVTRGPELRLLSCWQEHRKGSNYGCFSSQSFWKSASERKGSHIGSSFKSAGVTGVGL
jgi:hypothetical protein